MQKVQTGNFSSGRSVGVSYNPGTAGISQRLNEGNKSVGTKLKQLKVVCSCVCQHNEY